MMEPIAYIKSRELDYIAALKGMGAAEWRTNLGLVCELGDEGLYSATQVNALTDSLAKSFEQSVTDPENQPSQYGTVPMDKYVEAANDLQRAIQVLDALWDKKRGTHVTQEWAKLLAKYGKD
jgi:hypothetical protein